MSNDREAKLRRALAEAHEELGAIEAAREAAALAKLDGKCFKYRNSYSGPLTDDDSWWLYMRITKTATGVNKVKFQDDKHGRLSVERDDLFSPAQVQSYIPITLEEYEEAWLKFSEKFLKEAS